MPPMATRNHNEVAADHYTILTFDIDIEMSGNTVQSYEPKNEIHIPRSYSHLFFRIIRHLYNYYAKSKSIIYQGLVEKVTSSGLIITCETEFTLTPLCMHDLVRYHKDMHAFCTAWFSALAALGIINLLRLRGALCLAANLKMVLRDRGDFGSIISHSVIS